MKPHIVSPFSRTRNVQVRRVLRLIALLQRGYWAVSALAAHLNVSERTIRRDLAAMRHDRVRLDQDGHEWRLSNWKGSR